MRNLRETAKHIASHYSCEVNEADKQAFILLRALIMLTNDALSRYEALKQHHQKLDFDDLIERCQILLSSQEIVDEGPSAAEAGTSTVNQDWIWN